MTFYKATHLSWTVILQGESHSAVNKQRNFVAISPRTISTD
jgi:hypothetical protein